MPAATSSEPSTTTTAQPGHAEVAGLAALWPAGAVLAFLNMEVDTITPAVFLALDAVYVLAAVALLARFRPAASGPVGLLAAAPVVLFALAGITGAPTGEEPELLLLNTGVLLVVALLLLLAATELVFRHRSSEAAPPAVRTLVLLVVASAGYVVNLVGRVAVYLTDLGERQRAVESSYWDASAYLRGLPTPQDPLAYLLTWMDLLQLAYVAAAYAATAGLARLLGREEVAPGRSGRRIAVAAWSAVVVLLGSIVLAIALPSSVDEVPAGVAFGMSIPFMSTLLPFALAVCVLVGARRERAGC